MSSRSSSWDEAAASTLLGLILVVTIVVLIFTIWLSVKIIQLLIRVFVNHPTSKVLWALLAACLLCLLLAVATSGQSQPVDTLTGLSALLLVGVAAVQDVVDDTKLRRPLSRDTAVHAVLHEWWPAA
ncbi:MAG: hypothetical protein NVS2B16_32570 [Chloroflexota bacterium]